MFETPYLKRLQKTVSAAIPGSNPQIRKHVALQKSVLEFSMPMGAKLMLTADQKAWRVVTNEQTGELSFVAPLDSDTGSVFFHVTSIFVKSMFARIFPEPGSNNVQQFMDELGEGSEDYEKFMGIFKFFMMTADGAIFENNPSLQRSAQEMVGWLRNDT